MLFMNSAMPNRPRASATSSMPSSSCMSPKVKRSAPVSMSEPTMPSSSPSTVIATPLSGEPRAKVEPASRPSSISEQISAGPNCNATRTRTGDRNTISVMPHEAPTKDASTVTPSATPPLPCWVIGKPSRQVTACGGWQGRLSRIEQIAPPYWAPYMTPASIRIAPTGFMPNVSGSRIETVASGPMPGSTPTMLPTSTPMKHHIRFCGSSATPNPYQRSVRAVPIIIPSTSGSASAPAAGRRTARRRTP